MDKTPTFQEQSSSSSSGYPKDLTRLVARTEFITLFAVKAVDQTLDEYIYKFYVKHSMLTVKNAKIACTFEIIYNKTNVVGIFLPLTM